MEKTLSIIKPDAVKKNIIGKIIDIFEINNLKITAMKMTKLSYDNAAKFYEIHKERPFFNDLCNFISSGPVVLLVLEGKNAVLKNRELMGATNPKDAEKDSIRARFADSIDENCVHGSDSIENAEAEVRFFFQD